VYQLALPADASGTIQAMKRLDINPPLMCGMIAAYTDPKFYAQLGGDAQGLMGEVQFSSDLPYPWLKQEVDNWTTVFGAQRPIDSFAAVYMTCAATVVDALERAKSSSTDKVMAALKATKLSNSQRFVTVPGGVQFDANGKNTVGAGVMVQNQDGKLTPIYPKPAPGKPIYPKPHWS
jgi:ABC-type branched-subunit amino acid transport system substrate-binding protein